jgi:AcrR family transcriptional regulator
MRDRILAAAVSVMKERGVTNTTTKEIARAAGVAEGSIYNHFATELIAASMAEVAGGIREALARLSQRVGKGTVEDNLTELAEAEITFFTDLLPIAGPVLGDHDLRE